DDIDIGKSVVKRDKGKDRDNVLVRLAVPELVADLTQKKALLAQAKQQEEQAREALAVAMREVEETRKDEARFLAEREYQRLRNERIQDLVRRRAQDAAVGQESQRQYEVAVAALEANRAKVATRQAKARAATADLGVAGQRIKVAEAEVARL